MNRPGWTLMELIVVVALMAVISAGAIVVVRAPLAAGRMQSDIDAALQADRLARSHALRFGRPSDLVYEIGSPATLIVEQTPSKAGASRQLESLKDVRLPSASRTTRSVTIPIDADGRSPSYGLRFVNTRDEDVWIVVAGGTGQPLQGLTQQDVNELLEAQSP